MKNSRFLLTFKTSLEGVTKAAAACFAALQSPFILNQCERTVASGCGATASEFPLIAPTPNSFLCRSQFGLFKRFKRQFQLWCRDLFHVLSVSRSAKSVIAYKHTVLDRGENE